MKAWLAVFALAVLLPGGAADAAPLARPSAGIEGTVASVIDGDTVWLLPKAGGAAIEVRLADIDAPEICQEGGPEAKAFLAELVHKQVVRLVVPVGAAGHDKFGRTLGTLWVADVQVNRRLVEEGQAWSVRYKWDRGPYVPQERMAKALSRGVHRTGAAIMPRDFRVRHGPCQGAAVPAVPTPAAPTAGPAAKSAFRCDGRTHCSQMTSCAEATFFLQNCPGVKLDGNRDGVPCETQWCRPR